MRRKYRVSISKKQSYRHRKVPSLSGGSIKLPTISFAAEFGVFRGNPVPSRTLLSRIVEISLCARSESNASEISHCQQYESDILQPPILPIGLSVSGLFCSQGP